MKYMYIAIMGIHQIDLHEIALYAPLPQVSLHKSQAYGYTTILPCLVYAVLLEAQEKEIRIQGWY